MTKFICDEPLENFKHEVERSVYLLTKRVSELEAIYNRIYHRHMILKNDMVCLNQEVKKLKGGGGDDL